MPQTPRNIVAQQITLRKATRIVAVMQNGGQDEPWIAFAGSCTTGKVAAKLHRDYVMIDLKPEYIEMGEKRVMEGETGIKVSEQKAGQLALFKKGM